MKHATRRTVGAALTSLTGLAALLIVAMLAIILLDVVRGGIGLADGVLRELLRAQEVA